MGSMQENVSKPVHARGMSGDIDRMKSDTSASVGELRDFIGQMHGKSPQEVLGLVAESSLARSMMIATIGFAIVLFLFTVVPYGVSKFAGEEAQAATAGEDQDHAAANSPDSNSNAAADSASVATGNAGNGQPSDPNKVIDTLGIGETKVSAPNKNPLDNKLDGLLDGVD